MGKALVHKYNYLRSDPQNHVMLAKLRSPPVIMVLQRDEKIQVIPQTSQASLPEVSKVAGTEITSRCGAAHFNPSTMVVNSRRAKVIGKPCLKNGTGVETGHKSLLSSELHTCAVNILFLWTTQC